MSKLKDLTGQRFSRLLVIKRAPNNNQGRACWLCRCDCGTQRVIYGPDLRGGRTRSCGCLNKELSSQARRTHGDSHSPTHRAWISMIRRCTKPQDTSYAYYGGRGITVCERWLHSYESFLADMGRKPTSQLTLDRIDNGLGYSPENCRWATRKMQANNFRKNRLITYNGVTKTISEWAETVAIGPGLLWNRLNRNWSCAQALGYEYRPPKWS